MTEEILKVQRNVRNTIRIIWSLLVFVICSYQVYLVCDLYFRYPTTVDIRVDPSPFVHLPGVTVCSELSSTILVEKLIAIEPSIYDDFVGKTRTEISLMLKKRKYRDKLIKSLLSQTIDKQHELTVSSTKFFKLCQLATPLGQLIGPQIDQFSIKSFDFDNWDLKSYNKINCSSLSTIQETISYEFKCFTLFLNRTAYDDINYQIPKDVAANLKYLAWIELNRDFMFNGLIYIHSPEMSHQYSSSSSTQQLDPDKHQFVSIAFERKITKLLPPPYATKCYDYRRDGYACRDDCMTQCKTKRYLQLDGWPGDVYADQNVTRKFSKMWTNPWSSAGHLEEGLSSESLASCSRECGHRDDCQSVQYDVLTARVKERDEDDRQQSHSFTIGILPPKNFQIINEHVPKFQNIEFLVNYQSNPFQYFDLKNIFNFSQSKNRFISVDSSVSI
ncbi:hypothetical protein NH340_JMT00437 [Sarcoptes scabiei]|nr:hypothetical protein NH340_JMT00437 [Sarcoptes scabiei]